MKTYQERKELNKLEELERSLRHKYASKLFYALHIAYRGRENIVIDPKEVGILDALQVASMACMNLDCMIEKEELRVNNGDEELKITREDLERIRGIIEAIRNKTPIQPVSLGDIASMISMYGIVRPSVEYAE